MMLEENCKQTLDCFLLLIARGTADFWGCPLEELYIHMELRCKEFAEQERREMPKGVCGG